MAFFTQEEIAILKAMVAAARAAPASTATAPVVAQQQTLQTITDEASPCCRKGWAAAMKNPIISESFQCQTCGLEYRPTQVGTVRHWVVHAPTMRFRGV